MFGRCLEDLAATDFPAPWGAVSWALGVFTSEFGMGSGGGSPPWPPGCPSTCVVCGCGSGCVVLLGMVFVRCFVCAGDDCCAWWWMEPIGRLGPVSCMPCGTFTSGLSTWWSTTALLGFLPGRPGFEVGFPLRCFQRLSRPHIATRPCRWRDNRFTRGASIPVLSY